MTAHSTSATGARSGRGAYRIVGAVIWFIGAYTTYAVVDVLAGDLAWYWTVAAALLAQAALTALEHPIWTNMRRANWLNWGALVTDAAINASGALVIVSRIPDTPVWALLEGAVGKEIVMGTMAYIIIALVVGVALAAMPEGLWRAD